jgi:ABC-type antimicrobial peptide transport system permease subunit
MLGWIVITVICTIGGGVVGFLAGYVHSNMISVFEQTEEKIRNIQMRLIASQVCREWKEKEWAAERERKGDSS